MSLSGHGSLGRIIPGGRVSQRGKRPCRRWVGPRRERSRRWPRPPLRPERSPSGLAGLRSGQGQRPAKPKTKLKAKNQKTKIRTKTKIKTKTKKGTFLSGFDTRQKTYLTRSWAVR